MSCDKSLVHCKRGKDLVYPDVVPILTSRRWKWGPTLRDSCSPPSWSHSMRRLQYGPLHRGSLQTLYVYGKSCSSDASCPSGFLLNPLYPHTFLFHLWLQEVKSSTLDVYFFDLHNATNTNMSVWFLQTPVNSMNSYSLLIL